MICLTYALGRADHWLGGHAVVCVRHVLRIYKERGERKGGRLV